MIYYHATPKENIFSILKNGIHASFDGLYEGVYLCKSPEECLMFFTIWPNSAGKEIAVIPLDLDESKIIKGTDHDKRYIPCDSFMYLEDIPANKIPPLNEILLYKISK